MVAFTAGAVLTAANLNSAFNALTIRTVTGTSDTLVLADAGGCVTYSNASPVAVTVPLFSSIAYATGTKIVLVNLGAGTVTVAGAVGVTVNGSPLTLAQNAGATLIKTATNTWSFLPFSSGVGAADFSDTATGSYTGYKYKTFTASGTLNVTTAGFADIVVCGGGGGGGSYSGSGGGGAGGVLAASSVYLPVGTHTVTIGAGAPAGHAAATGYQGVSSRIQVFYGVGGGGGGGRAGDLDKGNPGGSGGGGAGEGGYSATIPGTGLGGQGNDGGNGTNSALGGGGGGGAAAVGANSATTNGGAGGAGTTTSIAGTTPNGSYVAGNYALGGGGGGSGSSSGGAGGSGGGGAGAIGTGSNGTANTGGGGGAQDGQGGSGIVIVRVAV